MREIKKFYVIKRYGDGKFLKLSSDIYGEDIITFEQNVLLADKFKSADAALKELRYHPNCEVVEMSANEGDVIKQVCIPACENHEGLHSLKVNLHWRCPICGMPRGEVKSARSYDGSLVLMCDSWENPCGHTDYYENVRQEALQNGLNGGGNDN